MKEVLAQHAPRVIGLFLIYTGIYKLILPVEATTALATVGVSAKLATFLIVLVVIMEIYLGTILFAHFNLRFGIAATSVLILCFTAFLWYLSTLAHPPACGCLGLTKLFISNRDNAVFGMMRNWVLLWVLMISYKHHHTRVCEKGHGVSTTLLGNRSCQSNL